MENLVSTGCASLDRALGGGLPSNGITLLYGEAETGKTSLAIQCAILEGMKGHKTLYVDADGSFSLERLHQIASEDFMRISELIVLVAPLDFNQQSELIDNLEKYISRNFSLIVFDTITTLYRSEFKGKKEIFVLNRELNRQVATLKQISKSHGISILLTSQVRDIINLNKVAVAPVATRVLKFWSDKVVGLTRLNQQKIIQATIEKIEKKESNLISYLIINYMGVHDYED